MNESEKIVLLKLIKEANSKQIMALYTAKKINSNHLKYIQENLSKSDKEIDQMIERIEVNITDLHKPKSTESKQVTTKQTTRQSTKQTKQHNNVKYPNAKQSNQKTEHPNNKQNNRNKKYSNKKQNRNKGNKNHGYYGNNYDPNYKENKRKYGDAYDPRIHATQSDNPQNNYFVNKYSKDKKARNRANQDRYENYRYEQALNKRDKYGRKVNSKSRKHKKRSIIAAFKIGSSIVSFLFIFTLINPNSLSSININDILNNEKLDTANATSDALNTVSTVVDSENVAEEVAISAENAVDEVIEDTTETIEVVTEDIEPITADWSKLQNNTLVERDACSTDGSREANAKADIGYADREYYAYTNEYSQLVYVTASQLVQQYKSEENSDNRYCSAQANVYDLATGYNRGHVIGDQLGGVSNAYNIFPQLEYVNGGEYNNDEMNLQSVLSAGGNSY